MTTPTATQATEWRSRLRSSVRCSIRLMPGSSARSVTALRALSILSRSATLGDLGGCDFRCSCCTIGIVRDGVENGGECGVADRKAGGRWHEIQVAGGGDGKRFCCRFSDGRLLVRVAYEELFGNGRGDGVLASVSDRRRDRSGGFHGGNFFPLLLLVGYTEFLFHLHAELVGGAAKLRHELAQLACELRQLLRPEEKQGEKDEDGAVLEARHNSVP